MEAFENVPAPGLVETVQKDASALARRADAALRENPIPAIITAVAIGFGIGLLARALQPAPHPMRDCLDETSGYLHSAFKPVKKKAQRAYDSSSRAVRGAVEDLHDIDLDPVAKWWKRLWA